MILVVLLISFLLFQESRSIPFEYEDLCHLNTVHGYSGEFVDSMPPLTPDGVQWSSCLCYDSYGWHCQFSCPGNVPELWFVPGEYGHPQSFQQCYLEKKHDEQCVTLMVRQNTGGTQLDFLSRTYTEYVNGFSDAGTDCATFHSNPTTGECFYGLEPLHEFAPVESNKFMTLEVTLRDGVGNQYQTTCMDFGAEFSQGDGPGMRMDRMYFAQCSYNTAGDKLLADSMASINEQWFKTVDQNYDMYGRDCPQKHGGGWWYDGCMQFIMTGEYGADYTSPVYGDVTPGLFHQDFPDVSYFQMDVCKYGCPPGFYGENCDQTCDPECEINGGTCSFVYNISGDAETVGLVECACPPDQYGRLCQYNCPGLTVEECMLSIQVDPDCQTMYVGDNSMAEFLYPSFPDWVGGWESIVDAGEINAPRFYGLMNLHAFSPYETQRPSSITYRVTNMVGQIFSKTCFDPVFTDMANHFRLFMAPSDHCIGDAEILSSDILYNSQVGFSMVYNEDYDTEALVHVAASTNTAFWHRKLDHAMRHNPFGDWNKQWSGYEGLKVSEVPDEIERIEIEICRYRCPEGTYGVHCNTKCPQREFCLNGGRCNVMGSYIVGYPGLECICPSYYYGTLCQYYCPSGDIERCIEKKVDAGKECTPMLIRNSAASTGENFDKPFDDYVAGFGTIGEEYWAGLENMRDFLARKTGPDDFSTVSFKVRNQASEYEKTCIDFSIGTNANDEGYQIDLAHCFGDDEFADEDLMYMKKHKFSASNLDQINEGCGTRVLGGWWYAGPDCYKIHPTGRFGGFSDGTEVKVDSIPGTIEYFRVDVCNYYLKETCEDIVVHQTNRVDFNRSMRSYSEGFGDCASGDDCFNSLDYVNYITNQFVELDLVLDVGYSGNSYEAQCKFRVDDKDSSYNLMIRGDTCTRDNELSISNILYHNGMDFYTRDSDTVNNCAQSYGAGWWYNDCYEILPTGEYGENMKFESLNSEQDDTVYRFNVKACGNIKGSSDPKYVDELRGKQCKKILIRKDAEGESFDRNYGDYLKGFGDCHGGDNCWIGLEELARLTETPKKFIIDVTHRNKDHSLGCLDFQVTQNTNTEEYEFDVGTCYGSAALDRDMLYDQAGKPFTTMDHPPNSGIHCAGRTGSGWFYDGVTCGGLNPTGFYGRQGAEFKGIFYESVTTLSESATTFEISLCGVFDDLVDRIGCTQFLTREDGSVSFDRTYEEYVHGFGDPTTGDGWLGLEALYQMSEIPQFLDIKYVYDGEEYGINCGIFFVEGAEEEYTVHFKYCDGDDLDFIQYLDYHNGARFSTYDHPIEEITPTNENNCGVLTGSGWWFGGTPCHRFHPTGEFGSTSPLKGINFGTFFGLESVQMSICRVRDETRDKQSFDVNLEARSCARNCGDYTGKEFKLREAEQLFVFNEEFFENSVHVFLDVFTGPSKKNEHFTMPTTGSFYSAVLKWPVIFRSSELEYKYLGEPAMMYLKETCMAVEECGWGTSGFRVGSAYIPPGFKVTFFDLPYKDITAESGMYEMGGGQIDREMTFNTLSWKYEVAFFADETKYPVLYRDILFTTAPRELRYSCTDNCGVGNYRSLYVPKSYVVELFSHPDYNEGQADGITRKFVGPVAIDIIDGYFGNSNHRIESYKAALTTIKKIEVRIVEFLFDEVTASESASTNVNELVVANPSNAIREVTFEDTYEVYEERNWKKSEFLVSGSTNETVVEVTSTHTVAVTTKATVTAEVSTEASASASAGTPFVFASASASVGAKAGLGFEIGGDYTFTHTDKDTDSQVVSFEKTTGSERGGVVSKRETKSFTYQCVALPYTKTTCQAKQVKGVFNIPYIAKKVIIYTDDTVDEEEFEGVISNAVATHVYFVVQEQKLSGFCLYGFTDFNGDCYRGVKMAEEEDVSDLAAAMKSPLDINYLEMSYEDAELMCYKQQGAEISSIHSGMENYQVHRLCHFYDPIVVGVLYFAATDTHVNVDRTEFDYSRFRPGVTRPGVDSYVAMDEKGYWYYIPMSDPPEALCVVCKKDLNVQLMAG